jgi:hypothetical protein
MDDRRLDNIEQALLRHARVRQSAAVPHDFTAKVMRSVRQKAEQRIDFWDVFGLVAQRFVPVGAVAATAVCGYVQFMDKVFNQALLSLSMHSTSAITLAGLMP